MFNQSRIFSEGGKQDSSLEGGGQVLQQETTELLGMTKMQIGESEMSKEQLITFGEAIYGNFWIPRLARDIDYAHSTVWRWVNPKDGDKPIPRKAAKEIRKLAKRKKFAFA